jgi:nicotinamidase-related amidase
MSREQLPLDILEMNFRRMQFQLDPKASALLVIDMQRFFLDGSSHAAMPEGVDAIPRINTLIKAYRNNDAPVIFTRHVHPEGSDPGTMGKWWNDVMWEGDPLLEIDPKLDRREEDKVITKQRYDAFLNTDLEEHLRSRGVTQVVITGVMTNLCCETTARTAYCRDFEVFFVHDCTGTSSEKMHNATLRNLVYGFAILLSSDEVLGSLGRGE